MSDTWVVMLNWNAIAQTRRAIESVLALDVPPNLVVVDNGSGGDEAARLRGEYPAIETLALPENVGFARAVNEGAKLALRRGARSILLLNNDAWFAPRSPTLALLEERLATDRRAGAVGPRILNADGTLQSEGYGFSFWFPIARKCRGERAKPRFLSGSCLLIRAASFARLGGLDPDFFLYGDDVDFAVRLRGIGQSIVVVKDCFVFHERAASNSMYSPNYAYTGLRSSLINLQKHARFYQYPTAIGTLALASCALAAIGARARDARVALAALRAWYDFAGRRWGGYSGQKLLDVARPSDNA